MQKDDATKVNFAELWASAKSSNVLHDDDVSSYENPINPVSSYENPINPVRHRRRRGSVQTKYQDNNRTKTMSIGLTEAHYALIDDAAVTSGVSRQDIVRMTIDAWFTKLSARFRGIL